jgi:hypothetical protein
MNLIIDSPKSFKSLKIRFELSTVALTNLTIFGVAVGATALDVEAAVKDRYQSHKYLNSVVAHVNGFQIHIAEAPNSSI